MEPSFIPEGVVNSGNIEDFEEMDLDNQNFENFESPRKDAQDSIERPFVGMFFDTMEEAKSYYTNYGQQEGFCISTRSSWKSKSHSDEVTSKLFVCAHYGKFVKKPAKEKLVGESSEILASNSENPNKTSRNRSTVKGGCGAYMRIIRDKHSNKWKVSVFNDLHNHKGVSPFKRMNMSSNRHMPKVVKVMTEAFHRENMEICKVPSIFGGAQIGFNNRDCYNHLRNVRHREFEGGDAQSVLNYFKKKQAENPQFFYAIQCDENSRACNFFWVDARSHMAYQYFGDVVIKKISKKMELHRIGENSNRPINEESNLEQSPNLSSHSLLLDPNISQTKGRNKDVKGKETLHSSSRIKSGIELSLRKKERKCALCQNFGHDERNCPSNPKRKKIESTNQFSECEEVEELA